MDLHKSVLILMKKRQSSGKGFFRRLKPRCLSWLFDFWTLLNIFSLGFLIDCIVVGMVVGVAVDRYSKIGRRESVFIQCLQSSSPMLAASSSSIL